VKRIVNLSTIHSLSSVIVSPVNANRAGVNSSKGSYMKRYAQIINRIKKHRKQNDEPVFFLCENVTLEWEDLSTIEPLFGVSPIEIDAQFLSPIKRKRSYITNVSTHFVSHLSCIVLCWFVSSH